MPMPPIVFLILISACINTAAQLLLKAGADRLTLPSINHWPTLLNTATQMAINPFIMIGLVCYVASVSIWIVILSKVPVSFAYPLMSLAYITTAVAAAIFFNEQLTLTRMGGILIIIFGVYLISRS